jgi:hypothetical protein
MKLLFINVILVLFTGFAMRGCINVKILSQLAGPWYTHGLEYGRFGAKPI